MNGSEGRRPGTARGGARPLSPSHLVSELLAPLAQGRGVRVGCIGITGSGKSFALRRVAQLAVPYLDVTFVVDGSENLAEWNGGHNQRRVDLRGIRDRPLVAKRDGGAPVVVFEGNVYARRWQDGEELAAEAWRLASGACKVAMVWDEFTQALAGPQQWSDRHGWLPYTFSLGRKPGVSVLWATQFPQEPPREAFRQSDLLLFTLADEDAEYLRRKNVLTDAQAQVASRLGNGEFVVRRPGLPWDGHVYRF